MSEDPDRSGMLPEYDFSAGVRGKYVSRLGEKRAEMLEQALALDRQAWVANALEAVQDFESRLVSYWSIVHDQEPDAAGATVSGFFEGRDGQPIEDLRRDLDRQLSVGPEFHEQLVQLLEDRNWLVHRSFHGFSATRVQSIVECSGWLSDRLWSALLERCGERGIERADVEARAEEIVERWAASRSAA